MLSYRFHSLEDHDRSSISYLRSNLSATRLITTMGTEFGTSLSNFPFVPYGISLALRVSYRELRFSKTPLHRSMARSQLLTVCDLLQKFSDRFAFARRLATLAVKTVREMDKVAASVLQARYHDFGNGQPIEEPLGREGGQSNAISHIPEVNDNAPTAQQEPNHTSVTAEKSDRAQMLQIPQYDAAQYNAESFDIVHKIPDLPDLFERFDPEFNLDAVDFALVQNVGADDLPDFGLSPDMDWVAGPENIERATSNAENYELNSVTT